VRLSFAGLTVTCAITGSMLAFADEVESDNKGEDNSKRSRKVLLRGI